MAGLVGSVFQTTFAAISFAGAGFLFQHFNKSGYENEIKRHNKALESLAAAKEKFYENEVRQHDRIQQLRQQLADANADIEQTNQALDLLRKVHEIQFNGRTFSKEPQLSDFYKPSDEMREYQYITMGLIGIWSGYVFYKII